MTNTGRHTTEIGSVSFEWGRRTYVMGVVNMTPDSFSGDGLGGNVDSALRQALSFQDEGADIVDVGGESTRPPDVYADASAASEQEEMDRVIPTIEALAQELDDPDQHRHVQGDGGAGGAQGGRLSDQRRLGIQTRTRRWPALRPRRACRSC